MKSRRQSTPNATHGFPLWALLFLLLCAGSAYAETDDLRSLELYNGAGVDIVFADRSPRPASQTAENITVVTESEIEALNAHTLAHILYTVTGVQLEMIRTPGAFVNLEIQGSKFSHILVLIDNVPINVLSENFCDIASVPVQMIERIEIVKGAASSSWGSALGGVVNVITKTPRGERPVGGLVSGSYGKRETVDGRAELSGTVDRFGYYLAGGKLRSDGLLPNNAVDLNSAYGKLQYDLPLRGSLALTTWLSYGDSGQGRIENETPIGLMRMNIDTDVRQLISTLSLQLPLSDRLSIQAMLRTRQSKFALDVREDNLGLGLLAAPKTEESATGGSVMLSWLDDRQRIVAGVDYDYVEAEMTAPLYPVDDLRPDAHRVGVYLNDTITLGAFAVTPSARFDRTGTGADRFSPSLGLTYALSENSVLRGYTAKGYSITSLNRSNSTEKVWTSQLGFESSDLPYLWLKGTVFRNEVEARPPGSGAEQNQLKQGYELELGTTPLFDTSLLVGYTFIDARDDDTDRILPGIPRHTLNIALKYQDSRDLRALLNGRHIDWNGDGTTVTGKYHDIIWDLHLGKAFRYSEYGSIELFLSLRNIFNGNMYIEPWVNPRRWGEVGVRCTF